MIRFREELYFTEAIGDEKKRQKLLKRLQNKKFVKKDVMLITYAANGKDLFDMYAANEVKYPWRKDDEIFVLGIAKDREDAIELAKRMVMEVYQATGSFDVRAYFGY